MEIQVPEIILVPGNDVCHGKRHPVLFGRVHGRPSEFNVSQQWPLRVVLVNRNVLDPAADRCNGWDCYIRKEGETVRY
mgnify:CR=1 FL=1